MQLENGLKRYAAPLLMNQDFYKSGMGYCFLLLDEMVQDEYQVKLI